MKPSGITKFLTSSKYIDATHPDIIECAAKLANDTNNIIELIESSFLYVWD